MLENEPSMSNIEIQKSKSIDVESFYRFHQKMAITLLKLRVSHLYNNNEPPQPKKPLKSYTIQLKCPSLLSY